MLTVVQDTPQQFAEEHGNDVSNRLFGQETNAETYAICTPDLLLKGERESAEDIRQGGTGAQ